MELEDDMVDTRRRGDRRERESSAPQARRVRATRKRRVIPARHTHTWTHSRAMPQSDFVAYSHPVYCCIPACIEPATRRARTLNRARPRPWAARVCAAGVPRRPRARRHQASRRACPPSGSRPPRAARGSRSRAPRSRAASAQASAECSGAARSRETRTPRTPGAVSSPPRAWYAPHRRTHASRGGFASPPRARWHRRTASCAQLTTPSCVSSTSSPAPATASGSGASVDASDGLAASSAGTSAPRNVRAARMFPSSR
jgi:hypothetical protein